MAGLSGAALGDLQLAKRLIRLVDDLSAQPTQRIPLACRGLAETKTAYRLLDHEAMDWWVRLTAHGEPTTTRMGQENWGLCLQDTTALVGRKGDSHPGLMALWEGLIKLLAYVTATRQGTEHRRPRQATSRQIQDRSTDRCAQR
jgi:hypothetical protein